MFDSLKRVSCGNLERTKVDTNVFCRINGKKMPNCVFSVKCTVGQPADDLYVQFYAHIICDVETTFLVEEEKGDFTVTALPLGGGISCGS